MWIKEKGQSTTHLQPKMPRRPSIKKKVKPLTDDELGRTSIFLWFISSQYLTHGHKMRCNLGLIFGYKWLNSEMWNHNKPPGH